MLRKIGIIAIMCSIILLINKPIDVKAEGRSVVVLKSSEVIDGTLAVGETVQLLLTFSNMSSEVDAEDVLLYSYNSAGEVYPVFGDANPLYAGTISQGDNFETKAYIYISNELVKNGYLQLNFTAVYHDAVYGDATNTMFLSLAVSEVRKLNLNNISQTSDFTVDDSGIINVEFANTGKISIDNLKIRITGNIDGNTQEYYVDSLGTGIESSLDGYVKFVKSGEQEITVDALYTDSDGVEQTLATKTLMVAVAEKSTASDTQGVIDTTDRNSMLIEQITIIGFSLVLIFLVVIWKNKRYRLINNKKEAR